MIKAAIFDLDHTLFNRHETLRAIVPEFRKKFELNPKLTDDEVAEYWIYGDDNYVYLGWKYIFAYLCEHDVFINPPEYADYRSFIFENFAKTAVGFKETLPMLETLKKSGLKVGLITNGQHALQYKKLELTGLRYIFDEIIISGDVMVEKPDKEIFFMMTDKLNLLPEECVYVGDNPVNDILGAKKAGFHTIWMKSTGVWNESVPKPDAEAERVEEIPDIIRQIKV